MDFADPSVERGFHDDTSFQRVEGNHLARACHELLPREEEQAQHDHAKGGHEDAIQEPKGERQAGAFLAREARQVVQQRHHRISSGRGAEVGRCSLIHSV